MFGERSQPAEASRRTAGPNGSSARRRTVGAVARAPGSPEKAHRQHNYCRGKADDLPRFVWESRAGTVFVKAYRS